MTKQRLNIFARWAEQYERNLKNLKAVVILNLLHSNSYKIHCLFNKNIPAAQKDSNVKTLKFSLHPVLVSVTKT